MPWPHFSLLEDAGVHCRQHERHVNYFFRVIVSGDVSEANVWLTLQNALFKGFFDLCVVLEGEFSVHVEADLVGRVLVVGLVEKTCGCDDILPEVLGCSLLFARDRVSFNEFFRGEPCLYRRG